MKRQIFKRMFSDWRGSHTESADVTADGTDVIKDKVNLARLAAVIGEDWKSSSYYDDAEQYLESAWTQTIWPYISDCDFSCVVDLAAGHGRNTQKLRALAQKLYVVDINEENIDFCRTRFLGIAG